MGSIDAANDQRRIAAVVELAKRSDVVLLVLGDVPPLAREGVAWELPGDRSTLGLGAGRISSSRRSQRRGSRSSRYFWLVGRWPFPASRKFRMRCSWAGTWARRPATLSLTSFSAKSRQAASWRYRCRARWASFRSITTATAPPTSTATWKVSATPCSLRPWSQLHDLRNRAAAPPTREHQSG